MKELFLQLLVPLLAEVGGRDDEDSSFPLRPALREYQTRLDRLAQAHLVGKQSALGERRSEGKKGRIDLMRVQIDLRPATATAKRSALSEDRRRVRSCAMYFAW